MCDQDGIAGAVNPCAHIPVTENAMLTTQRALVSAYT
ncbi:hypothetical protein ABIE67_010039 [Streptomyces sp. V4I8]